MFETRSKPLLPRRSYYVRVARSAALGLVVIAIALGAGMFGYHYFEGMPWIDAFANAAMILSGMGPLGPLSTADGKLFAGFYALFSGLIFVVIMGIVFAPVVHRFMHRFHLEEMDKKKDR
jgi:NhaP-type Na+/H+ or K+/H+ antiporter